MSLSPEQEILWQQSVQGLDDLTADYEPAALCMDEMPENVCDLLDAILVNRERHNMADEKFKKAMFFIGYLMLLPDPKGVIAELPVSHEGESLSIQLKFPTSGEANA